MNEDFLTRYNDELRFLKELGAEFAESYPKVGGRLGMQNLEIADPYVERLLEGFAFLSARVQHKMDAQFPRMTQQLLDVVMPTYSAPLPAVMVAQLTPDPGENVNPEGFAIPRDSALLGLLVKGEQTRCEFRTAHDVDLFPIEVAEASYVSSQGALEKLGVTAHKVDRAGIRIRLRSTAGLRLNELAMDEVTFYLDGVGAVPGAIYEQIFGCASGVTVAASGGTGSIHSRLPRASILQVGFSDEESLLPSGGEGLSGYRLLQEYFALPQRFNFVRLTGLRSTLAQVEGSEVDLVITTDQVDQRLLEILSADNFRLFCTPIINLFPKRADRIQVTGQKADLHILPDRTRPMDFEVYDVTEVKGFAAHSDQAVPIRPLYESEDFFGADEDHYYVMSREQRLFSTKQQRHGARSSYLGTECTLQIVDRSKEHNADGIKQLEVITRCTNRDLPLQMALGQGGTDFDLQLGAPVEAIRSVTGLGLPGQARGYGDVLWRLINTLSLNYLSLIDRKGDPTAIKNLLRLFADTKDPSMREQIDGLRSIESKPVTHRLPSPGPICFGRGLEITLTFDESAFEGTSCFMLGAVLERFFARYVTLNTFTRTRVVSHQRGELVSWPNRVGLRDVL